MKVIIFNQPNGKFQLMGEFELSGSGGVIEQRIIASNLSRKKAETLKTKYDTGKY